MKIVNYTDYLPISNIVQQRARYQKVMLIYDDTVSNTQITEIFKLIKENCIFNSMHISNNLSEANNGYRLLIFLCSSDSFLKCNLMLEDFINVFIPTDDTMLPYFITKDCKLTALDGYLFLKPNRADLNILPSVYFNIFYNYLYQLCFCQTSDIVFSFEEFNITQLTLIQFLEKVDKNIHFIDVEILKAQNLSYRLLPMVDYVICCAFSCFINSVKQNQLNLVDIYKAVGDNYCLLDKYYAKINNALLYNIVQLNAHCLQNLLDKTINKILIEMPSFSVAEINEVIASVKNYAKQDDGILGDLYLYNVFNL